MERSERAASRRARGGRGAGIARRVQLSLIFQSPIVAVQGAPHGKRGRLHFAQEGRVCTCEALLASFRSLLRPAAVT